MLFLKNSTLFYLVVLLSYVNLFSQETTETGSQKEVAVKGYVKNQEGIPIANALVFVKGEKIIATATDTEGAFVLYSKKEEFVMVFSHIAYKNFERKIKVRAKDNSRLSLEIILKSKRTALDEVMVLGKQKLSTAPSIKAIKKKHLRIAGGTSVAIMNPNEQRLETIKDALKLESGVIIQEFFGANDQPRINIRGSGIQSNPQRRGLYFLQDGIPINFADGSFITGAIDPSISESVEVFKGANAMRYGSATLGGAINFNSRTGRHSKGVSIKTEGGSYDYGSVTALLGEQWDAKDAFLSISGSQQHGFRQHNQNKKLSIASNFGCRFSDRIENRTFFNYSYINFDIPGPLTLDMIKEDPTQINKGVRLPIVMGANIDRDKPSREATVMRVANKTIFQLGSGMLSLTGYYQYIQDRFVFPIVLSTQRSYGHDIGSTLTYELALGNHKVSAGLIASYGFIDRRGHINKKGLDSFMFSKDKLKASNITIHVEDQFRLSDRLQLITNIQMVYNERNSEDVFPNPALRPWYSHSSHKYRYFHSDNSSSNQIYRMFNPRMGFVYNAGTKRDVQFFGNISTSYEPPTFDELVGTAVTNNINTSPKKLFSVALEKQTAITTEIGTRYEGSRIAWNISLYQSWLKNELLEVKDFVLGVKKTKNYPQTIHKGIELGVMAVPFKGIFSAEQKDQISLRTMYTYSDFYFSSGAYKNNKLAGVPPHYLSGSIEYRYDNKLFLSVNVESQPKETPVDHTNTLYQPSFSIYGFRVGVQRKQNWSFYIEGKNVFNNYYASSYIINDQIHPPPIPFPKFTAENITFFMPGQTRAFYVGVTYNLI